MIASSSTPSGAMSRYWCHLCWTSLENDLRRLPIHGNKTVRLTFRKSSPFGFVMSVFVMLMASFLDRKRGSYEGAAELKMICKDMTPLVKCSEMFSMRYCYPHLLLRLQKQKLALCLMDDCRSSRSFSQNGTKWCSIRLPHFCGLEEVAQHTRYVLAGNFIPPVKLRTQ